MDDFSLGAFLGAFVGGLAATPFWFRALIRQINKLQSCAHKHADCPTILPVSVGAEEK